MPSGLAIPMIDLVIWISAVEGVGSPEGWLWTRPFANRRALKYNGFLWLQYAVGVCSWDW